ncbi:head GIN domain-containing protein [Tenacibaculum sp. FZY0031]|uniref:head GIN domain-containing protein n=1 Tax=unclassified Tenacibaculum TaxID=2635139 RepID=UPI002EBABC5D|nr:head GIN domain-containing protein [Tenacibaculum sp. FZY0031]
MKKQFTTIVLILLSITVNSQSWWGAKKIKGNGNVITETRKINSFDKVNVGGSFDVYLTEGTVGKLSIEGEENILKYIETEVKNGKLNINFKENTNIHTTKKLTVTVPFEDIESVALGGSGNVIAKKRIKADEVSFALGGSGNIVASVEANTIKASIGGSGNIKLKGKTDYLKCAIGGSGNIKGYDLKTSSLKASIAGSGDILTTVSNKIKATVVGSGSIYYKGNPSQIDSNSLGSGDVVDKN